MSTRSADNVPDTVRQPPPKPKVGRERHAKGGGNRVNLGRPGRRVQLSTKSRSEPRQPNLDPAPRQFHCGVGTHPVIKPADHARRPITRSSRDHVLPVDQFGCRLTSSADSLMFRVTRGNNAR